MNYLSLIINSYPNRVFFAVLSGAVSGLLFSLLIPSLLGAISVSEYQNLETINKQVEYLGVEILKPGQALLFTILCSLILLLRCYSQISLASVSLKVGKNTRLKFYNNISQSSIFNLESVGLHRLYNAITVDITHVVTGASAFPLFLVNLATTVSLLGFLAFSNFDIFKIIIILILSVLVLYQIPIYLASKNVQKARNLRDQLQHSVNGLILGAKELKLNSDKREYFHRNHLQELEKSHLEASKKSQEMLISAQSFGDLTSFLIIGFICFVFVNYHAISSSQLVGVVLVLLYITSPISMIMNDISTFIQANIAHKKIQSVLDELVIEAGTIGCETKIKLWSQMKLQGVVFSYGETDERHFSVGPIDLQLSRGKVTFITGGNGSGKSTLSKLLTLHYHPSRGSIIFDDVRITDENINIYRQSISAIYTDFYLFDELLIEDLSSKEQEINHYLKLLKIDDKVSIVNGRFSTIKLSDGQRKRLALLVSFLEDRDVYLFDEWAADQDPDFREFFYKELIFKLKSRNKLVLVVSHDNHYFDLADEIITMDSGKVVEHKKLKGQ
ncbi:cyclic peptide export ABC transporter [Pseudoalteromonas luteoviolacea]|uniref:cyclic peptide export ABC transporter n=1 Tax=Pseudoalteromonas luteoviolacea TaxID=43657 RepID=UPI001EEF057E|nr:cyclic peptide export ABC transporter [Pseudoalteromonas luteoviolacea]MCF6442838.1 cyclic peptide export ABC transporter [Pseudoalteromonas luteoviolacea]